MLFFARDGKHILIEYVQDQYRLERRLTALQAGNPRELIVVALMRHGGPRTERALHEAFRPWWVGGDWFERAAPIERTMRLVRTGALPPEVVATANKMVARSQAFRRRRHGSPRVPRQWGRRHSIDLTCEL